MNLEAKNLFNYDFHFFIIQTSNADSLVEYVCLDKKFRVVIKELDFAHDNNVSVY